MMFSLVVISMLAPWPAEATYVATSEPRPCQVEASIADLAGYSGVWQVNGAFDDPAKADEPVDFWIVLLSDGTFVDQDNYRGRWVAADNVFAFSYFDESKLLYVGAVREDRIEGNFAGVDTSGIFVMSRAGRPWNAYSTGPHN
jgi:hypothetical protein